MCSQDDSFFDNKQDGNSSSAFFVCLLHPILGILRSTCKHVNMQCSFDNSVGVAGCMWLTAAPLRKFGNEEERRERASGIRSDYRECRSVEYLRRFFEVRIFAEA